MTTWNFNKIHRLYLKFYRAFCFSIFSFLEYLPFLTLSSHKAKTDKNKMLKSWKILALAAVAYKTEQLAGRGEGWHRCPCSSGCSPREGMPGWDRSSVCWVQCWCRPWGPAAEAANVHSGGQTCCILLLSFPRGVKTPPRGSLLAPNCSGLRDGMTQAKCFLQISMWPFPGLELLRVSAPFSLESRAFLRLFSFVYRYLFNAFVVFGRDSI